MSGARMVLVINKINVCRPFPLSRDAHSTTHKSQRCITLIYRTTSRKKNILNILSQCKCERILKLSNAFLQHLRESQEGSSFPGSDASEWKCMFPSDFQCYTQARAKTIHSNSESEAQKNEFLLGMSQEDEIHVYFPVFVLICSSY